MRKFYLLELQFLGFRFHGWQKQIDVKTVQFMLDRTLTTVLGEKHFKTLGASRTDSMVSANHHFCQLMIEDYEMSETFIDDLNTKASMANRCVYTVCLSVTFPFRVQY